MKKLIMRVLSISVVIALLISAFPCAAAGESEMSDAADRLTAAVESAFDATQPQFSAEWSILSLARAGVSQDSELFEIYVTNVCTYLDENIKDGGRISATKSTENSRLAVALASIGIDGQDIGGHNIMKPLADFDFIKKQGLNGPIWALIALDAVGCEVPGVAESGTQATREMIVEYILSRQLEDGGWAISGTASDPDVTSMACVALRPYYGENEKVKAAVDTAIQTLAGLQLNDGGYASFGTENCESTAQVIIALSAYGIDADTDERFIKNGTSLCDALLAYETEGGFENTVGGGADGMASEQSLLAISSYLRYIGGECPIYDMSDVSIDRVLPFDDVSQDDWFYEAVRYAYFGGLFSGVDYGKFAPEDNMTRAMLVTVLYRLAGQPEVKSSASQYSDVPDGEWYSLPIAWASENCIVNGVDDGIFAPDDNVQRQQIAVILMRYAAAAGIDTSKANDLSVYEDVGEIDDYALDAMRWANAEGLINGRTETALAPQGDATRCEVAKILMVFAGLN